MSKLYLEEHEPIPGIFAPWKRDSLDSLEMSIQHTPESINTYMLLQMIKMCPNLLTLRFYDQTDRFSGCNFTKSLKFLLNHVKEHCHQLSALILDKSIRCESPWIFEKLPSLVSITLPPSPLPTHTIPRGNETAYFSSLNSIPEKALNKRYPYIREITCTSSSPTRDFWPLTCCPNLEKVTIDCYIEENLFIAILQASQRLTELIGTYWDHQAALAKALTMHGSPSIRRLEIHASKFMTADMIPSFQSCMQRLESFKWHYLHPLDGELDGVFYKPCLQLITLHLSCRDSPDSSDRADEKQLARILSVCPNVMDLRLKHFLYAADMASAFDMISSACKQVTTVHIAARYGRVIAAEPLTRFLGSCKHLSSLVLEIESISHQALAAVGGYYTHTSGSHAPRAKIAITTIEALPGIESCVKYPRLAVQQKQAI
jgi:hypothetical protein